MKESGVWCRPRLSYLLCRVYSLGRYLGIESSEEAGCLLGRVQGSRPKSFSSPSHPNLGDCLYSLHPLSLPSGFDLRCSDVHTCVSSRSPICWHPGSQKKKVTTVCILFQRRSSFRPQAACFAGNGVLHSNSMPSSFPGSWWWSHRDYRGSVLCLLCLSCSRIKLSLS